MRKLNEIFGYGLFIVGVAKIILVILRKKTISRTINYIMQNIRSSLMMTLFQNSSQMIL